MIMDSTVRKVERRFFSKVEQGPGDCWLWTAYRTPAGYGQFWPGTQTTQAHRWVYQFMVAEIPSGLKIDHLCRVRHCVNPYHMDPVTDAVNLRRGLVGGLGDGSPLTHCPRGHPYSAQNTYVNPSSGGRTCRTCTNERERQKRAHARRVA